MSNDKNTSILQKITLKSLQRDLRTRSKTRKASEFELYFILNSIG